MRSEKSFSYQQIFETFKKSLKLNKCLQLYFNVYQLFIFNVFLNFSSWKVLDILLILSCPIHEKVLKLVLVIDNN